MPLRASASTRMTQGRIDENHNASWPLAVLRGVAGARRRGVRQRATRAARSTGSSGGDRGEHRARRHAQRRGRHVPAARSTSEWAARFKEQAGTTVNYQGIGSGGGIAQFTAGTVDFGATDSPMKRRGDRGGQEEGRPVHIPTVLGAVTVSYNVAGREKGLKLDGATIADIFLGKIKKWNDPAIAGAEPGRDAAGHRHHGLPPLRRVGHDEELHRRSSPTTRPSGRTARRRQDGQVADRHRRQGQRRRRRLRQADRRASVGYVEQAYALQNNFTFARSRTRPASSSRRRSRRPRRPARALTSPADLRFSTINAPGGGLPDHRASRSSSSTRTCARPGMTQGQGEARVKAWLDYALGDGQQVAPRSSQYAPLPDDRSTARPQASATACSATGSRSPAS